MPQSYFLFIINQLSKGAGRQHQQRQKLMVEGCTVNVPEIRVYNNSKGTAAIVTGAEVSVGVDQYFDAFCRTILQFLDVAA